VDLDGREPSLSSVQVSASDREESYCQDLWIKILSCFRLGVLAGPFDDFSVDEGRSGAEDPADQLIRHATYGDEFRYVNALRRSEPGNVA
jgi:hypothetical protein